MAEATKQFSLGLNLDDYRYEARHCIGQNHCRFIDLNYVKGTEFSFRCPPWTKETIHAYGAAGKCNLVYYLLTNKLDYSSPTLQEVVYKDPLCGACDVACKRNLDHEVQLMLESLRARLVERGYGPMPQHVPVTQNIETSHNRYGIPQRKRLEWLPRDAAPDKSADMLYWVGCRADFVNTEISMATARILDTAGVSFMVMNNEPCCGHFVFTTGQLAKARRIAEDNLKLIRETGAKTVVFSCAEGYKTVKVDYPKLLGFATADLGFDVKHITELTDQWVKEGRLKFENPINMKLTYHDPCNLGRLSEPWVPWQGVRGEWARLNPPRMVRRGVHGVYEPPRNVLQAIPGIQLAEMPRRRDQAWCCGSDAGVKEAFADFAVWTAGERLREAASTGAEAIVSCCPACKENFSDAVKNGMKIFDITELIATAIGK